MSLYRPNSYPVCQKCVHENVDITEPPCVDCQRAFRNRREKPNFKPKPKTNADRIRAMTDEELAVWLSAIMDCSKCVAEVPCAKEITTKFCKDVLCDWLKSPVEVDNGT